MLKNSAGENPYIYNCPWCGALKGCLCKDEKGTEYKDGSYHRARLMNRWKKRTLAHKNL